MHPARIFGYTATDKGMFNKAEKLLKGLFGERLIYIPYSEAEQNDAVVPLTVWFVRTPPVMLTAGTMEGKLKQGIRQCKPRNELIGKICSLVPKDKQVIVFVNEVKDHLIPLHKELPHGTRYIHRDSSKTAIGAYALTAKQQKDAIKSFMDNEFQFMMATNAFRAGVDIPNVRVVVQAAGGCSEVELLQEALRASRTISAEKCKELGLLPKTHAVLIDFLDNHEPALESMAYKRRAIYESQGWTVREVDAPEDIDWSFYKTTVRKEKANA